MSTLVPSIVMAAIRGECAGSSRPVAERLKLTPKLRSDSDTSLDVVPWQLFLDSLHTCVDPLVLSAKK